MLFFFQTNDNAEMTNKLQSEQHANKELAAKFSEASLELVEYKDQVRIVELQQLPQRFRLI